MRTKTIAWLLAAATPWCLSERAAAQGTAFTYQGRLNVGGAAANGSYDLQFGLFTTNQSGLPVAPLVTNAAVSVNNGLFTTTLDFGSGVFGATNFWLEIGVRPNGGGAFVTLAPRPALTPVPLAIAAESANNLPGLTVRQNANGAPNLIGGSSNNFVTIGIVGATIGGGGAVSYNGTQYTNKVTGSFGTVGGGSGNSASAFSTVSGGNGNTATGGYATVGGGNGNFAGDGDATVGGGADNSASLNDSTCLQPSEFTSDRRNKESVSLVIGTLRAFAS